jgi:lysozyme family protein
MNSVPQALEQRVGDLETATDALLRQLTLLGNAAQRQEAARLREERLLAGLRGALARLEERTVVFAEATRRLEAVIASVRANPIGDVLEQAEKLAGDAAGILATLVEADGVASAHTSPEEAEAPVEGDVAAPAPPAPPPPPAAGAGPSTPRNSRELAELAGEYAAFFAHCRVRQDRVGAVDRLCALVEGGRARYEAVGGPLAIPWYFIAAIHALESGCNFRTHLHNGDPLSARTVRVPAGHPKAGTPPFSWEASATDALTMKKLDGRTDWSLPRQLHRLEAYNGFGYRSRGIPTPYLWSFSNHYEKGKFVRDGVYDAEAVSRQCGAATLLRRLVERGTIQIPGA